MRRSILTIFSVFGAGLLSGCTGTGVFFDHTTQWFSRDPNMPAGSSETFLSIRGEKVDIPPLVPESGNVWPTNNSRDLTLQDVQKQQDEEIRRNGGQPSGQQPAQQPGQPPGPSAGQAPGQLPTGAAPGAGSSSPPPPGSNPRVNRANDADRGLPGVAAQPPPPPLPSNRTVQTPNGPSVDVTGQGTGRGYRQLESPTPGGSGILVPNGNGTSTLIRPDGSVQTVPTRP